MSKLDLASLPPSLQSVHTRPLFVMRLDVRPIISVGNTPGLNRRLGIVPAASSSLQQSTPRSPHAS
ncbi:hypothetical protein [Caballeronia sp.]|uniref:hypothetical protein n=1 Tax=Caballeronia sp. TaxID=1931223 RepID=UPI003C4E26C0